MSRLFDKLDEEQLLRFRKTADNARAVPVAFLKFDSGVWKIGGDDATDSTWLALVDQTNHSWKRFESRRVVEEVTTLVLDNEAPPRPNSHSDRDQWETGTGGWKQDPWSRQLILPLLNEQTKKVVLFTAGSVAGRVAVAALLEDFAENRRRQTVALTSELVRVDGRDIREPKFEILSHSENDEPIKIGSHEGGATTAPKTNGGGSVPSDDIPF